MRFSRQMVCLSFVGESPDPGPIKARPVRWRNALSVSAEYHLTIHLDSLDMIGMSLKTL